MAVEQPVGSGAAEAPVQLRLQPGRGRRQRVRPAAQLAGRAEADQFGDEIVAVLEREGGDIHQPRPLVEGDRPGIGRGGAGLGFREREALHGRKLAEQPGGEARRLAHRQPGPARPPRRYAPGRPVRRFQAVEQRLPLAGGGPQRREVAARQGEGRKSAARLCAPDQAPPVEGQRERRDARIVGRAAALPVVDLRRVREQAVIVVEAGPPDPRVGGGPGKRHQVFHGQQRIAPAHKVEAVAGKPEARLEAVFAAQDFERRDGGCDLGGGGGQEGLVRPPRRQHRAAVEVDGDIAGARPFEPGRRDQRVGSRRRLRVRQRGRARPCREAQTHCQRQCQPAHGPQLGRKRSQWMRSSVRPAARSRARAVSIIAGGPQT